MTFANTLQSDEDIYAGLARSEGVVEITFRKSDGISALSHMYQSGCGRVRFPSVDNNLAPEAVLINTSGGLTGGDRMTYKVIAEKNSSLTVTGQAAEKIYKSVGPDVHVTSDIFVEAGAILEWLPQETIIFNNARLNRVNRVNLQKGANFIGVEATVLGRLAHKEIVRDFALIDGWEISLDGDLIWYDRFRFDGDLQDVKARSALLDGAQAFATLISYAPEGSGLLDMIREAAEEMNTKIGASEIEPGFIITRLLDEDPYGLRKSLKKLISLIRSEISDADVPMPTVWEV